MKEVVRYWCDEYQWKEREKKMNSVDHFKTNIEGIDIHFIHSRAADGSAEVGRGKG